MSEDRSRVVVLASGAGSLAAAVLDAAQQGDCPFEVVALVSDRRCPAVEAAAARGLPTSVVAPRDHADRAAWDHALAEAVAGHAPELVVSAGFMRILGPEFLDRFPGRVLNTHPALLPSFPGAHAVRDALAHGVRVTGCTVHVVDAGVDTGPIVEQRAVEVLAGDSEATLHERIKSHERTLLVEVLAAAARGEITIEGRKVVRS